MITANDGLLTNIEVLQILEQKRGGGQRGPNANGKERAQLADEVCE